MCFVFHWQILIYIFKNRGTSGLKFKYDQICRNSALIRLETYGTPRIPVSLSASVLERKNSFIEQKNVADSHFTQTRTIRAYVLYFGSCVVRNYSVLILSHITARNKPKLNPIKSYPF
jgi:hypothetical protein